MDSGSRCFPSLRPSTNGALFGALKWPACLPSHPIDPRKFGQLLEGHVEGSRKELLVGSSASTSMWRHVPNPYRTRLNAEGAIVPHRRKVRANLTNEGGA